MQVCKLRFTVLSAALLTLLSLSGCGNHTATLGSSDQNNVYSIDETYNGDRCFYQSPQYDNNADYCAALESTSLNCDQTTGEECGRDYRHTVFDENCDGTWTVTH
jgi:hypothetical protein